MSDVSVNSAVQAVSALQGAQASNEAQMLILRKAMDNAADNVSSLIESLPQPALATSGHLGTQLNVYA